MIFFDLQYHLPCCWIWSWNKKVRNYRGSWWKARDERCTLNLFCIRGEHCRRVENDYYTQTFENHIGCMAENRERFSEMNWHCAMEMMFFDCMLFWKINDMVQEWKVCKKVLLCFNVADVIEVALCLILA